MFKGVRAVTYRQRLFIQLVLIFSFFLSSNGLMPRYLLETFSIESSFVKGLYTLLIIVIVFVWLADSNFFRKTNRVFVDSKKLWLPLLFVFYVIGVFVSQDTDLALRSLERHMAILLVPFIIYSEKRSLMINSELIFKWFRVGVIVSQLSMFLQVIVNTEVLTLNSFVYNNLTLYNHTSYVAIASTLSLILAYREFYEKRYSKWTVLESLLNIGFIFLFNSKSGIICLFILLLAVGLRRFTKGWTFAKKLVAGFVSLLLFVFIIIVVSKYNKRFEYALRSVSFETIDYPSVLGSSEIRRAVWSLTPEIIDGHWLLGQGTGDIHKKSMEVYKKFGFKSGYVTKVNSHNQFIEVLVSLGGLALLVFLVSLVVAWLKCKRNYYSILILGLFILNFCFESLLERQSGILMFTCFYGMIFILTKSYNLNSGEK